MITARSRFFDRLSDQKTLKNFSWICLSVILLLTLFLLSQEAWKKSFLIVSVMAPSLFFLVFQSQRIPPVYVSVFVLVSLFNVICIGWGLYTHIVFMDEFAHFVTAFALVPCCSHALFHGILDIMGRHKFLFGLVGFSIGISVGALWEIFEYVMAIEAQYVDTITDLIFDTLGAGLAAFWMVKRLDPKGLMTKDV